MALKLEDLSKDELLRLYRRKFYRPIDHRELVDIRVETLSQKAEKMSKESMKETEDIRKKGEGLVGIKAMENHIEYLKASRKFDKAMKIWAEIDKLYLSIGIGTKKT